MQAAAADKTAKQRLSQLDTQLNELKKEQAELTKQWEKEKEEMQRLQSIKNEIDRVNLEIQSAERDYDLNRAAELKYGTVLQLQKQLKEAEEALEKEAVRLCNSCLVHSDSAQRSYHCHHLSAGHPSILLQD